MTTNGSAAREPARSEPTVPPFAVISGAQVQDALQGREKQIVELVEATYRLHGAGASVNPPSYFLRFPDRPTARIIALPASIGGQVRVDGLKWISSFPENVAAGIPRASAVLILNDHDTGYPFACLESSIISATRTAASAALAADWLSRGRERPTRVGFFGVGLIARYIQTFLDGTGWSFDEIGASYAEAFGTEDRGAVERYCRANGIEFEWQPDGGLRTRQRRSAVVRHPVTGQRCWFNQIPFLNEWTIAPEVREYLVDVYGAEGLPFNTRYGNGDPIGEDVVELLNTVYEANTAREPWQAGDLLLVDNVRTAHAREAFEGPREVLVAMADAVRLADCSPTVEVTA